jgi:SnoaL-like polyketide cyclase
MSIEQDKATARRWFHEVIAQQKLGVADEIYAATHVIHDPHAPPGGWPDGPAGLKAVAGTFGGAFSGWHITIDDQIAERDRVVTRWTATAVHNGTLPGLPPTGRTATVTGANISRFDNGKIAESWFNFDMLGLLQQLGAVPV